MTLTALAEIIAIRLTPIRPAHSISEDPQADSPPSGTFARRRTDSNALGRLSLWPPMTNYVATRRKGGFIGKRLAAAVD
jgi:hypothetical protein